MIAPRRILCAFVLIALSTSLFSPISAAGKTKQQKLAQNIRKLKQAHADLDTLYRRLAGKEISDHRKESFGRKWTRALRDIDKYTGKVRRYGGSPSAPSRSYMSWEIMAKKVSWQSQASEAAEKRDEAKKEIKAYQAKLNQYLKSAKKKSALLKNSKTKMSDKTVAAEVALYKKMYRKILSIVEKINIRARRYQTPLQKMPSLPATPPVAVTIVSQEEENADKHLRKLKIISQALATPGKSMTQEKVDAYKRKYTSEYQKALFTTKNNPLLNKKLTEYPFPLGLPVKVTIVSEKDKAAQYVAKLTRLRTELESGQLTAIEIAKSQDQYRKALSKLETIDAGKAASFKNIPHPVPATRTEKDDAARTQKLIANLDAQLKILGKPELTQDEIDDAVYSYRLDYKKLKRRSAQDAVRYAPEPRIIAKPIKPVDRRKKFIRSLEEINSAITRGVTEKQYDLLKRRFTGTKSKLNTLEARHSLPVTQLGIAPKNIKSDAEIVEQYRKELKALDKKITDAGFFRIASGDRSRTITRRKS